MKKFDINICPLLSYLEQHHMEELDNELIREFHEAAKGGKPADLFQYGLLLHQYVGDEYTYGSVLEVIPQEVQRAIWEQAYNVFAHTAGRDHGGSMLMMAWCTYAGLGTPSDPQTARFWLDAAKEKVDPNDPSTGKLLRSLEAQLPSVPKLILN